MNESLRKEHLEDGNVFISYSVNDDKLAEELGYKFIGAGTSKHDGEIHIWLIEELK